MHLETLLSYAQDAESKLEGDSVLSEISPTSYEGEFTGFKLELAVKKEGSWESVRHSFTLEEMRRTDFEDILRLEITEMLSHLKRVGVMKEGSELPDC